MDDTEEDESPSQAIGTSVHIGIGHDLRSLKRQGVPFCVPKISL